MCFHVSGTFRDILVSRVLRDYRLEKFRKALGIHEKKRNTDQYGECAFWRYWSSHAIVHVMDGVESLSAKQSSIDG